MTKIVFPRCLELISGRLEDPVNFGKFGLKKGTGVDPPPRVDNVPFFYRFFYLEASLRDNFFATFPAY